MMFVSISSAFALSNRKNCCSSSVLSFRTHPESTHCSLRRIELVERPTHRSKTRDVPRQLPTFFRTRPLRFRATRSLPFSLAPGLSVVASVRSGESVEQILESFQQVKPHPDTDVVVVGCGPAGLAVSYLLAEKGVQVTCVGSNPATRWIPNYGVWLDEYLPLGYPLSCLSKTWSKTSLYLQPDGRNLVMPREYGRVNREAMQIELLRRCRDAGVKVIAAEVSGVTNPPSTLSSASSSPESKGEAISLVQYADGSQQSARTVVDATGHGCKLLKFDREQSIPQQHTTYGWSVPSSQRDQGVQVAYGIEADVEEGHGWDLDEMVLMDFRSNFLSSEEEQNEPPTFLYVMPMSKTRVFVEETSLVARPPLSFDWAKKRLYKRLESLGVKVTHVHEVELCYIPMGGDLPIVPQPTIGFGGAARLVHPATGYMLTRALSAAPPFANALASALLQKPQLSACEVSQVGWDAVWSVERRREREFYKFGMEVLLEMDYSETRIFFDCFFSLPEWTWHNFLAQNLRRPEIIQFGLRLFISLPNRIQLKLMQAGVRDGGPALLASLLAP
uniref:lycopene beta-cyclase n=1 Tax=Gloeochaete wittrockiana TaxID=38269 RepID=A0A290WNH2_9EUKA|nr:lycopene beta-cyclase [Gloeochaete wittrockiana]